MKAQHMVEWMAATVKTTTQVEALVVALGWQPRRIGRVEAALATIAREVNKLGWPVARVADALAVVDAAAAERAVLGERATK